MLSKVERNDGMRSAETVSVVSLLSLFPWDLRDREGISICGYRVLTSEGVREAWGVIQEQQIKSILLYFKVLLTLRKIS